MDPRNQLFKNQWNWDFTRFCQVLEIEQETEYAKELWFDFQALVRLMKKFDTESWNRLNAQ